MSDVTDNLAGADSSLAEPINSSTMPHLANAQVSGMSNEAAKGPIGTKVLPETSCDGRRFRQEAEEKPEQLDVAR